MFKRHPFRFGTRIVERAWSRHFASSRFHSVDRLSVLKQGASFPTTAQIWAREQHSVSGPLGFWPRASYTDNAVSKVVIDPGQFVLLRDRCSCARCIDTSTRQKLFQTADIPADIRGQVVGLSNDGRRLKVHWQNDVPGYSDHVSEYDFPLSQKQDAGAQAKNDYFARRIPWDKKIIESQSNQIGYNEYMNSDRTVHDALQHLVRYGLLFIKGVPDDDTAIENIVSRIGILKVTFYGKTWDVRSVRNAKNIAYTQQYLGLHMDLL
jgi:hypothetical protein